MGAPAPLHVKLYSLSFALAAHLSGETILSAEPLNLLLYLLLVYLAHRLGTEAFGARAGWFAAAALALWPSLLLHTTQLLKDSCYLIAILALALLVSRWLTRVFGWRAALWNAAGCAGVIAFAGALRHATGGATLVCVAFGGGLLLLRQRRARQWLAGNSCAALLVALVVAVGAARGAARFRELRPVVVRSSATQTLEAERGASPSGAASANCLTRARARLDLDAARLGRLRRAFAAGYSGSGSTIDGGCTFDDAGDVLRYVPRALAVGWFAPFPGDWMQTGAKFGAAGRRISGLEMLLLYGVELLACFGLWQERRNLCAWLLFLSGAFGLLALGLVVANAGALYRLRYAPFALLVVVAAGGWRAAMDAGPSRKFVRLMNRTFSGRIRRG